jgi:beta-galactosidase GanA
MYVGSMYFRPPNPRREDWEQDLALVKKTGLDMIRIWLYWCTVNPKENKWVWDQYDQIMDLAQKNNLKVLIQYMCDAPPVWFIQKYPETLYVDENGKKVEVYSEPAVAVGTFPGLCFNNPKAISGAEEYMIKVAERYWKHPALYAYDLWNEIWLIDCFCSHTQKQFQNYIEKKYCNIEALNTAWHSQHTYDCFSQVKIPKRGVYAVMMDRYEFEQHNRMNLLKWRYNAVKAIDDETPLVAHGFRGIESPYMDNWYLVECVDVWGTSSYDTTIYDTALTLHASACTSKDKPWWLAETASGRTWRNVGDRLRTDEFLRSVLVLALGFGAEATLFWQWRPEIFGQEAPHFGLTGLDGKPTSRTDIVKGFTSLLKKNEDVFSHMKFPNSEIGLLWEPKTVMYEAISGFKQNLWLKNFIGWHRALLENDYAFDILNSRIVDENGLPAELKILFAPMQIFMRERLKDYIERWIYDGGIFVSGPWFGMYDEKTYANRKVPPVEWFGVQQNNLYYIKAPIIELLGELRSVQSFQGEHFIEALNVIDGEALGVVDNHVVLAGKKLGKGKAFYIGTFAGNKYDSEKAPELRDFIGWAAQQAKIKRLVKDSSDCLIRTAESGKGYLVFVTNPKKEDISTWLTFSSEVKGVLVDITSNQSIEEIEKGKPINIQLSPEDSKILYIKN